MPGIRLGFIALALVGPSAISAQSVSPSQPAPATLIGEFLDDYGVRYSISAETWVQGGGMTFEVLEWDPEGRFVIARNGASNPSDPGLWTRIDWLVLESGSEYEWAFCYAVYRAGDPEEARTAADSTRDAPRSGCNGFPFSRMKRAGA